MRIGKLENSELESLILNKFKSIRPESLTVPRVGEDCAALDFQGDLIVMSMDPITSAGDKSLGLLSVHVNCNDAVCMGAEPVGLLVTLLLPPDYPTEGIGHIADDLAAAAQVAHVDILGGHTEYTDAVTRPVTCTSVVARMPKDRKLPGLRAGDDLVMTRSSPACSPMSLRSFGMRATTLVQVMGRVTASVNSVWPPKMSTFAT